jgi:transposase
LDGTVSVTTAAAELGVRPERLYEWRQKYRSGGAEALRDMGRPSNGARAFDGISAASSSGAVVSEKRIEELERKIGQRQLDVDFFRAALRHVREQRLQKGESGETPSTR